MIRINFLQIIFVQKLYIIIAACLKSTALCSFQDKVDELKPQIADAVSVSLLEGVGTCGGCFERIGVISVLDVGRVLRHGSATARNPLKSRLTVLPFFNVLPDNTTNTKALGTFSIGVATANARTLVWAIADSH